METGNLIYLDIDDIPKVVGLRLDELISWRWELVFVPVWVLFALAMIGVSYSVLLAVIFFLSTNISNEQRHASLHAALSYTSLIIPGLISQVLLARRLDGDIKLPYSVICIPLLIALTSLIMRSFSARGGNLWWCGMQKDFCLFLLDLVPSLREYGNVSYQHQQQQGVLDGNDDLNNFLSLKQMKKKVKNDARAVVPMLAIDLNHSVKLITIY